MLNREQTIFLEHSLLCMNRDWPYDSNGRRFQQFFSGHDSEVGYVSE